METILTALNAVSIAPWEAVFFALLISVYVLLGLTRSCFMIIFGFTFYWGLKNFMSQSHGLSDGSLLLYVVSGLLVIGLVSLNYFLKEFRSA